MLAFHLPGSRNHLATIAIAKVIIGLAKEGERDAGRLCALALKPPPNSLLTGKITGNFADSGVRLRF